MLTFTTDVLLKGQYTIYDADKEVIAQTDNLITDWGMNRLFGNYSSGSYDSTAPYAKSFVSNFSQILLGSGYSGATNYTPTSLISAISSSSISFTTPEPSMNITLSSLDPSGLLTINFVRTQKFIFSKPEIIKEIGCSWTESPTGTVVSGLFSRAELPPDQQVRVSNNTTIYVKYNLTVAVKVFNDINPFQKTMTSSGLQTFPPAKLIITQFPFYTMNNAGNPSNGLNDGYAYNSNAQFIPPLFEDFGQNNSFYSPRGWWSCGYWGCGFNWGGGDPPLSPYNRWFLAKNAGHHYTNTTVLSNAASVTASRSVGANSTAFTYPNIKGIDTQANVVENITIGSGVYNSHTWSKKLRFIFPPGHNMMTTPISSVVLYAANPYYSTLTDYPSTIPGLAISYQTPLSALSLSDDVYCGYDFVFNFTRV